MEFGLYMPQLNGNGEDEAGLSSTLLSQVT